MPPGNLKKLIESAAVSAFNELYAVFLNRVFLDGQDNKGTQIGVYSTKPIYVSLQDGKTSIGSQIDNTRLKPRGKDGSGEFKNGKPRKSMYFKGGYSQFRKTVSRKTDKVYLSLSGQLQNDIRTGKSGGFLDIAIVGEESSDKARGNEERFNKEIFSIGKKEETALEKKIEKEAERLVLKSLGF